MELLKEQTVQEWQGCYSEGWDSDLLTPEAFSHPAKFSKALITRIITYMLERGYIQPGQTILDPFGGVGLGAVCTFYGLNWIGCELEQKFHDIGAGCDCTGISAETYRRFFSRFRPDALHKLNYADTATSGTQAKDGRHLCPACLAALGKVEEAPAPPLPYHSKKRRARIAQLQKSLGKRLGRAVVLVDPLPFPEKYRPQNLARSLFDEPESGPIYRRNSGIVPTVAPHRYEGNLARFKKYAQPGTTARLIQGDSRKLRQRLTEEFGGLVSSPPYANGCAHTGGDDPNPQHIQGGKRGVYGVEAGYGDSDGQLGAMPPGSLADSLITSPPFAGNTGGRGEASRQGIDAALFDRHSGGMKRGTGDSPDNLDHLPLKGFTDALISSPPYVNVDPAKSNKSIDLQKNYETYRASGGGQSFEAYCRTQATHSQGYGSSNGQLSGLPSGSLDAAISSPPFADSVGSDNPEKRGGLLKSDPRRAGDRNLTGSYGASEGQLGAMKAEGLVSSPPFEEQRQYTEDRRSSKFKNDTTFKVGQSTFTDYGQTDGQLGIESKETFWAAARQIVTESYLALKPGAYSAWVCKKFVRDGAIVDFPDQWKQLCESVGFEYIETIRAMLVSPEARQGDLEGGTKKIQKAKKSFFRRLAEKNGSPAIDFEEIVILRKPL